MLLSCKGVKSMALPAASASPSTEALQGCRLTSRLVYDIKNAGLQADFD